MNATAERRTTPVELFWDLAFVFAITQVTHFLLFHLTWGGFLRGMILLALYVHASRRGNASWEAIAGFGLATLAALALLVVGSFFDLAGQTVFWTLALALDYARPAPPR